MAHKDLDFEFPATLDCVVSDLSTMLSFARIVSLVAAVVVVSAETHTIEFTNNCGFGTPTLVQNGNILSTGMTITVNGPIISAIAYLQTGSCGLNGEGCTIVNITLQNPTTSPGSGSCTAIVLDSVHNFSVTTGFGYFNGCDGEGQDCTNPNCPAAFPSPIQPVEPICCQANNVDLAITFCD